VVLRQVFSEETIAAHRDADRTTFDVITEAFAAWDAIDVRYRGEPLRSRGHAFSAIALVQLLGILQRRCASLDVDLRFETEMPALAGVGGYDLVVGADGVNSTVRRLSEDAFGLSLDVHTTKYAWFGPDLVFPAFTFAFREHDPG